jgi:sugar lactone lactonase YvrE
MAFIVHAQANYAGTESLVTSLQNEMVTGFTVDPAGNIYICDSSANQLDEAVNSANGYGALTPVVQGMCSPNSPQPPLAVDAAGYFYYFNSGQLLKAQLTAGSFGSSTVVASGLSNPSTIVLDSAGDVYISDNGTGRVLLLRVNAGGISGVYTAPITVMSGVSGVSLLAVDGQQNVYAAGGYGPSSGFVIKTTFNAGSYSTPQTLYSSFNDLDGLTVDAIGNVFVASDDSYQSPIHGNVNGPGAIVDLWEIPLTSAGSYGPPVPKGGGDFYVAQGSASDAAGNVYVLWIGGPHGGFSYNVEKISPHGPQSMGSVAVGSSVQQNLTFWVTGTEATYPTITVSTQGAGGKDFTTAGGVNCVPDPGLPFYEDGYPVACSATVTFTPQTTGVRTGGALLISGDTGKPISGVSLTGVGAGPHLVLDPGASLLFHTGLSPADATAADTLGNFYTADFANHRVVKLPWTGTSFGAAVNVVTGLQAPDGVAVDGFGNIFVTDSESAQVQKVPWTGSGYGPPATIFSGTMFYFEGGTEAFAPAGVTVDLTGNVFVLESDTSNQGHSVVVELPRRNDGYGPAFEVSGDGFFNGRSITSDGTNLFVVVDGSNPIVPGTFEQAIEFQQQPNTYPGFAPPSTVVDYMAGVFLSVDGNGNLYYLDQSYTGYFLDEVREVYFGSGNVGHVRTVYTMPNGQLNSLAVGADGTLLVTNAGSYTVQGGTPVTNTNGAGLLRIDRSTAAPVDFLATNAGATSTDSPHIVVAENIGNSQLNIAALNYPADFPKANGDPSACATLVSLGPGASCDLPVQFTPLSSGLKTESVSFTDNSLNHAATQSVSVSGTGNGPVTDAQIQLSISSSSYAYPGTATLTVKLLAGASSHAPTGTVQLLLDGISLTTLTLNGSGLGTAAAYFKLPVLPAASHALVAVYSGDARNSAGTSSPLSFVVLPAPVALAPSCSNSTEVHGADFKCYVYTTPVAAGSGTMIGVQYDGDAPYTVLLKGGVTEFSLPDPAIGSHHVVISYTAQGNYAVAASKTVNFNIIAP